MEASLLMLRISALLEPRPGGRWHRELSLPCFLHPRNFEQAFQLISDDWSHWVPYHPLRRSIRHDSCLYLQMVGHLVSPKQWSSSSHTPRRDMCREWKQQSIQESVTWQADVGIWENVGVRKAFGGWTKARIKAIWEHRGLLGSRNCKKQISGPAHASQGQRPEYCASQELL